ncbi:MAG: hypothetical protein GDA38_25435 [Hormoscilla sp. SP12CHS1]|nr:hypothetical protein [Hormoscilla sp. SP12CHS1]
MGLVTPAFPGSAWERGWSVIYLDIEEKAIGYDRIEESIAPEARSGKSFRNFRRIDIDTS